MIFDNDLVPGQTRNLEQAVGVKVLDRTELILDIFASNAQTYEARLAVELAQLEYSLPRLKRMWTHLSRMKMGIGMRGPGEKQLEVDRRLVEKRIHELKRDLHAIERRKERLVAARNDRLTVSLVGYTNAGKSTLMNALTGAGVLRPNKLFATLDTRTRRWQLPSWGPVLLSRHGRLHPRPAARPDRQLQGDARRGPAGRPAAARRRRGQPGGARPDQRGLRACCGSWASRRRTRCWCSTRSTGLPIAVSSAVLQRYPERRADQRTHRAKASSELHAAVSDALSRSFADLDVETSVANGRMLAFLAAHGEMLERRYDGDRVVIHCRIPQRHLGPLHEKGTSFRPHTPLVRGGGKRRAPLPIAIEEVA